MTANPELLIRNISDTARWVAFYRGRESERPDALFRDPFARRLAGERGEQIAASLPYRDKYTDWPFVMRTVLIDQFLNEQLAQGVDMVINLAAGLDSRPYRMKLPATLQWVEADLPEMIAYKEEILAGDQPVCRLERVRIDLSDAAARQAMLVERASRARNALVLTEGLLIYLDSQQVDALARELQGIPPVLRWILDLSSPAILRMMNKQMGERMAAANAPYKFAPREGPFYFEQFGWKPLVIQSLFKNARNYKRLRFPMTLLAMLPDTQGRRGFWGGVCLYAKENRQ